MLADYVEDEEDDGETAACDCAQSEGCACCGGCGEGDEEGEDVYLMKIVTSTNEEGEEMEEFIPVEDDDLMEKLIEIVQTRFGEDDEEE